LEKLVIEIIEHQDGLRKEFMHKQAGTLKVGETLSFLLGDYAFYFLSL